MTQDRDKNSASGNKQSDFAGTNTDRYDTPKPADEQDNPIQDNEAQNVADGDRLSSDEAEKARNKANEGKGRTSEGV